MAARPLNVLSLCSGAGGLELGVHVAEPRARTVCYVEREAYAAACLVARMENAALDQAPVWDDVGTFDATAWRGCVDIVTSGDPCQPNSVAGKGLGTGDDRWLLDRVLKIFDQSGATTLFRENVAGNADGQLAVLVPALEAMGCTVAAGIFSAKETGANHQRERLFVMAHRPSINGERQTRGQREETTGGSRTFLGSQDVAHRAGRGQREFGDASRPGRGGHADGGEPAMGDATGPRHSAGRPDPCGPLRDETRRAESDGRRAAMADASSDGSAAGLSGQDAGQEGQSGIIVNGGYELPLSAPGPSDPRWPAILDIDSLLAPALGTVDLWAIARRNLGLPPLVGSPVRFRGNPRRGMAWDLDKATTALVKSEVRRISHVLANRVDRLRLAGNGVYPMAASLAYRTLSALLADAGTAELVLMEAAE